MSFLIDTNVLLRLRDRDDPRYADCVAVVDLLKSRNERLCVCAQILIEYWVVLTRPCEVNGCGLSFEDATMAVNSVRSTFPCLAEPPDIADRWQRLVYEHRVMGKPSHDARIVALMLSHGVSRILTFNKGDFERYNILPIAPEALVLPGS